MPLRSKRNSRRRRAGVTALLACACACSPTLEPHIEGDTVLLSVGGIALAPGESRVVDVTVKRREGEAVLSVTGLPQGLTATFQPPLLRAGESTSELLLVAEPDAVIGTARLAIRAAAPGVSPDLAAIPTATLSVRVCPAYAIPTHCPPFETGGARSIAGMVLERSPAGLRPISGVSIWAWVQTATFGYSRGRVQSGSTGLYRVTDLPDSHVLLQAWSGDYDQPCGMLVELAGSDATANLELTPVTAPVEMIAPALPALSGEVFEITAAGRRPVAGARVYFEFSMDLVAATATTNGIGRYTLCRLPALDAPQALTVVKQGYRPTELLVSVAGMQYRDIELRRE